MSEVLLGASCAECLRFRLFQVRNVELRYTARTAGPVEEMYACHIFGMAQPLGFAIQAKNRVREGVQSLGRTL